MGNKGEQANEKKVMDYDDAIFMKDDMIMNKIEYFSVVQQTSRFGELARNVALSKNKEQLIKLVNEQSLINLIFFIVCVSKMIDYDFSSGNF